MAPTRGIPSGSRFRVQGFGVLFWRLGCDWSVDEERKRERASERDRQPDRKTDRERELEESHKLFSTALNPGSSRKGCCAPDVRAGGGRGEHQPSLSLSIWARQFGEPGLFFAPKLTICTVTAACQPEDSRSSKWISIPYGSSEAELVPS